MAVKCRQMLLRFTQVADSIAATSGKLMKIRLVAEYLQSLPLEQAAIAAIFFSGGPFPAYEQATLQVGGADALARDRRAFG